MISWKDVVKYISRQDAYEDVDFDLGDKGIVDFTVNFDGIPIYVLVSLEEDETNDDAQWIRISAPIGELTPEELEYVLNNINKFFVGGIYQIKKDYFCCSSLKLSSLTKDDLGENIAQATFAANFFIKHLNLK